MRAKKKNCCKRDGRSKFLILTSERGHPGRSRFSPAEDAIAGGTLQGNLSLNQQFSCASASPRTSLPPHCKRKCRSIERALNRKIKEYDLSGS